jgi:NAD(P)H-flavin reductase
MTVIQFQGESVTLAEGESVLDGLLRQGHPIPHGCRAGVCQSCVVEAAEGDNVSSAQAGLSDNQVRLNQFLSCQCIPREPLSISLVDINEQKTSAQVVDKSWLSDQVIRLRLKASINYFPGQYVTLWKDESVARSYSLASVDADGFLEFHIRHYPDGVFSRWVADDLAVGDELYLQGPMGKCFYSAEPSQPLLLSAIGTGLAPIYGILRDALNQFHHGPITLVVGAKDTSGLYLVDELMELARRHDNVGIHVVVQQEVEAEPPVQVGDIYQYIKALLPDMNGYRVYLCGAESFVTKMRKQCFLAGAGMSAIAADVFLHFADD